MRNSKSCVILVLDVDSASVLQGRMLMCWTPLWWESTGYDQPHNISVVSLSFRQPVCVMWVHMGKWICFPKSPLKLFLKKEGWGFGGNKWHFPEVLWLEMTYFGSADFRELLQAQNLANKPVMASCKLVSSPGWNGRIKGFCLYLSVTRKVKMRI